MNRFTLAYVLGALALAVGCGPNIGGTGKRHDLSNRDGAVVCTNPPPDFDGDGISDKDEGAPNRDSDHDGIPDYKDLDSDNDGIPDEIEGQNPSVCQAPVDSDGDGKPDFLDLDSDSATDSTTPDHEEAGPDPNNPVDTDGNGKYDFADPDNDGDGINDTIELVPQGSAVGATTLASAPDTDGDGIPDFRDLDSDNDGINDNLEGAVDTDGDTIGNWRDTDSDGDCIPDQLESGRVDPRATAVDTDLDGAPDFLDRDSDNDGLTDGAEDPNCNGVRESCETDRLLPDTDMDGVSDLIEVTACNVKPLAQQTICACDGIDGSQNPVTRGDFVFIVDYMKNPDPQLETLNLSTDVSQADVVFSIDTTGSMTSAINNLKSALAAFVPTLKAKVSSIAFGVVQFKEFGDSPVVGYSHRLMTTNTAGGVSSIMGALNGLAAGGGGDTPEAGWPALYSIFNPVAMTAASPWNGAWNSTFNLNATNPTSVVGGESFGTLYGAGFRSGSIPIVVTVTDAEFHDAYGTATGGDPEAGRNDYGTGSDPAVQGTPSRRAVINAATGVGARIMAIAKSANTTSDNAKGRGIATAVETGAVVAPADFGAVGVRPGTCSITQCCTGVSGVGETAMSSGCPAGGPSPCCPLSFSFDSSGNGVSAGVVAGIVSLASALKFDIHVEASDVDPNTIDNFLASLVPNLSGVGPAAVCITTAALQDNFTGPRATVGSDGTNDTFPQIGGGKQICFDVIPKINTTVMNTDLPQLFRARLQVRGKNGTNFVNLGVPREVFFLVPPVIINGPIG